MDSADDIASETPSAGGETRERLAGPDDHGERLDRWMSQIWPDLSRSRCKALVEDGRLDKDGGVFTDPSAKVADGSTYVLNLPPVESPIPKPEAIALTVLFEDAHLIVIDKPAGIAVHPAVGNWRGTLVNALLHHCGESLSGIGGVARPGVVHRLDKDTTGVMVFAKTQAAHAGLSALFANHAMAREYVAYVRFAPRPRAGTIDTRLARSPGDRKKMGVIADVESETGKRAITHYETEATFGQVEGGPAGTPTAAQVACRLETGRTHQIRAHLAHIGCPVIGDPVYGKAHRTRRLLSATGEAPPKFTRQALHARLLGFDHPVSGEAVRCESAPPADMARLGAWLEAL